MFNNKIILILCLQGVEATELLANQQALPILRHREKVHVLNVDDLWWKLR